MKKHIPNFITCLNLLTGSIGCITALFQPVEMAFYFIAICGIFDFLDGLVARLLHVKSMIGKELDSLADVVSFGLLPALVMYRLLGETNTFHPSFPYFGLVIVAFSALRLAKFNTDENQSDKFIGLPTPANAIMITTLPFLPPEFSPGFWLLVVVTIASSFLLVSPLTMIALKFRGLSWRYNALKYILIIAVAFILAAFQKNGLPFVIPAYIAISLIGNFGANESV